MQNDAFEVERLRDAIRKHRDQRGDDRCWLDDEELYGVLPEHVPSEARAQCDPDVMLNNCKRFIASRHDPSISYISEQRTIEHLQARVSELEKLLAMKG